MRGAFSAANQSKSMLVWSVTRSVRTAQLCAAALATLANRIRVNRGPDHLKIMVGVDGAAHESFSKRLRKGAVCIMAPRCDITFLVSKDSSDEGAAMVTAGPETGPPVPPTGEER